MIYFNKTFVLVFRSTIATFGLVRGRATRSSWLITLFVQMSSITSEQTQTMTRDSLNILSLDEPEFTLCKCLEDNVTPLKVANNASLVVIILLEEYRSPGKQMSWCIVKNTASCFVLISWNLYVGATKHTSKCWLSHLICIDLCYLYELVSLFALPGRRFQCGKYFI